MGFRIKLGLNWDSEFILISDYTLFILTYTSSLYLYLGTYLLNKLPISLPSYSPLWVYLPQISILFHFPPHKSPLYLLPNIHEKVIESGPLLTKFPAASIQMLNTKHRYMYNSYSWILECLLPFFPLQVLQLFKDSSCHWQ